MNKVLKIVSMLMLILTVIIVIATIIVCIVAKPHTELLGNWILKEEPIENINTIAVLYFYGYDNFKYDYYINLDNTGNEKSIEGKGNYTIDINNKKIKLNFKNGNSTEVAYITNNNKIQLVSNTNEEYAFVSNSISRVLEEVFREVEAI